MGRIPDRWEEYEAVGRQIAGTRFISFKVPLKQEICWNLHPDLWFTPRMLIDRLHSEGLRLGMVIDLTNTRRYYQDVEIRNAGIDYVKIFTEGHLVPSAEVQKTFSDAVDTFLEQNEDNDLLIGVHCTHGLNRTGYLVCRYLIDKKGFEPQAAIDAFNEARGYPIERVNYLNDLLGIDDSGVQSEECQAVDQQAKTSQGTAEAAGQTAAAREQGNSRQHTSEQGNSRQQPVDHQPTAGCSVFRRLGTASAAQPNTNHPWPPARNNRPANSNYPSYDDGWRGYQGRYGSADAYGGNDYGSGYWNPNQAAQDYNNGCFYYDEPGYFDSRSNSRQDDYRDRRPPRYNKRHADISPYKRHHRS